MNKINKQEAERLLKSSNSNAITDTLLYATFNFDDWEWVQNWCLFLLNHTSSDVKGLAATCIGHLARIHLTIDLKKVIPILKDKLGDKEISGRVEDALEDIEMFVKK